MMWKVCRVSNHAQAEVLGRASCGAQPYEANSAAGGRRQNWVGGGREGGSEGWGSEALTLT